MQSSDTIAEETILDPLSSLFKRRENGMPLSQRKKKKRNTVRKSLLLKLKLPKALLLKSLLLKKTNEYN